MRFLLETNAHSATVYTIDNEDEAQEDDMEVEEGDVATVDGGGEGVRGRQKTKGKGRAKDTSGSDVLSSTSHTGGASDESTTPDAMPPPAPSAVLPRSPKFPPTHIAGPELLAELEASSRADRHLRIRRMSLLNVTEFNRQSNIMRNAVFTKKLRKEWAGVLKYVGRRDRLRGEGATSQEDEEAPLMLLGVTTSGDIVMGDISVEGEGGVGSEMSDGEGLEDEDGMTEQERQEMEDNPGANEDDPDEYSEGGGEGSTAVPPDTFSYPPLPPLSPSLLSRSEPPRHGGGLEMLLTANVDSRIAMHAHREAAAHALGVGAKDMGGDVGAGANGGVKDAVSSGSGAPSAPKDVGVGGGSALKEMGADAGAKDAA
ncbi:hypothetical protein DFH09DRAFT_1343364 [Mycena vulgaris]|nr:hypothetical protein DFH09DRAFT_1343364 [Mycena vulgaris]